MQHPGFQRLPGPLGEVTAADEQRERGRHGGNEVKPSREGKIIRHAKVGRERERHRIHREGTAKTGATFEAVVRAAAGIRTRHAEQVTEALELACELDGIELPRMPGHAQFAAGDVHIHLGAAHFGEDPLDEPDAGHAGKPLNAHAQFRRDVFIRTLRRGSDGGGLQPAVVLLAHRLGRYGREVLRAFEIVKLPQSLLPEHVVDVVASGAAKAIAPG